MSISPLSSIANLTGISSTSQTSNWRQSFRQLEQSLASGNLSGAQSAFSSLTQKTANSPFTAAASSSYGTINPLAQDLNAIGQALQSGNLTQAQQSFGQLINDLKTQSAANASTPVQGHHGGHHHHGGGGASSSTTPVSGASTTPSSINVLA